MEVQVEKKDSIQILRIEGTLGIADVAVLKTRMIEALLACHELILDLDAVEDCDTAGVQLLVASTRRSSQDGKVIRLGRCSDMVRTTIAKLGLRLRTTDDEKEA
ncbi:MAG: STAS domain-containing protein [Alphaproteobacteria bacterium]|nr:STAS domain-containing protein [Alphaproteobacteria bacterium]